MAAGSMTEVQVRLLPCPLFYTLYGKDLKSLKLIRNTIIRQSTSLGVL